MMLQIAVLAYPAHYGRLDAFAHTAPSVRCVADRCGCRVVVSSERSTGELEDLQRRVCDRWKFELVWHEPPANYAANNAHLWDLCTADYVLWCEEDFEPHTDMDVAAAVDLMERNPEIVVVRAFINWRSQPIHIPGNDVFALVDKRNSWAFAAGCYIANRSRWRDAIPNPVRTERSFGHSEWLTDRSLRGSRYSIAAWLTPTSHRVPAVSTQPSRWTDGPPPDSPTEAVLAAVDGVP